MKTSFEEAEVGEKFTQDGEVFLKFSETEAALVIDESWLIGAEDTKHQHYIGVLSHE